MPTCGPSSLLPPCIHLTQRCCEAEKTLGSRHWRPQHYSANLIYCPTEASILKHCCTIIHFKRKPKFRNMLIREVCVYNRILQGFSNEGMLEEEGRRCGGEEIGSDSSAERCKVLEWLANLPDLGRLVFSVPSWR